MPENTFSNGYQESREVSYDRVTPYLPSVHSALASDIKLMRRANYEQLPILEILFRNFLNFSL